MASGGEMNLTAGNMTYPAHFNFTDIKTALNVSDIWKDEWDTAELRDIL